jgi:hypothetical protein
VSKIFPENRYTLYSEELSKNYDGLQEFHHKFKRIDQLYSSELGTNTNQEIFRSVNLSLVGDSGLLYSQNSTLDSGITLLVTHLGEIEPVELNKYVLPLDVYDYILHQKNGSLVSYLFRSLYFVYQNGMTVLNSLGQVQEAQI